MDRKHLPAGFLSYIINRTQKVWITIERELYAIVEAVDRFRIIVTIITDYTSKNDPPHRC
jgi:hypothetical protein